MLVDINPKIWGKSFWNTLYLSVYSYPSNPSDEDKTNMLMFLTSITNILPCKNCRTNYSEHIKKYPLTEVVLQSNKNLTEWLININNEVNLKIGKSKVNHKDIINNLFNVKHSIKHTINIVLIFVIIILVIFYIRVLGIKN